MYPPPLLLPRALGQDYLQPMPHMWKGRLRRLHAQLQKWAARQARRSRLLRAGGAGVGRSTEHGVNSAWTARLTALKGRPAAHVTTCGAAPQSPINASVSPALMTLRRAAHQKQQLGESCRRSPRRAARLRGKSQELGTTRQSLVRMGHGTGMGGQLKSRKERQRKMRHRTVE